MTTPRRFGVRARTELVSWPFFVVFLIALAYPLGLGASTALFICLVAILLNKMPGFSDRTIKLIIAVTGLVILSGAFLFLTNSDPLPPSLPGAIFTVEFVVTQLLSVIVLHWAIIKIGAPKVLIAYGLGFLGNATLFLGIPITDVKFALAIPAALIFAGLLHRRQNVLALAYFGIAVLGITHGARSFSAFVVTAVLLVGVSRPFRNERSSWSKGAKFAALAALGLAFGVVIYFVGTQLLLNGALGEYNKVRTATQLQQTGNLITSARPEWYATFGLMRDNFWAPGPGAVPDLTQLLIARTSLASIHFDGGDYVTQFMFGGHYELHSVMADMWVSFGVVGLTAGVSLFGFLLYKLLDELTSPDARIVTILVLITSLWYMLFGPLNSNLPFIAFALALTLVPRRHTPTITNTVPLRQNSTVTVPLPTPDRGAHRASP